MAYNATYEEADIAESVVNLIVKGLITVGTLIVVIVVLLLYAWVKKSFKF